jgi:hypothetical protein
MLVFKDSAPKKIVIDGDEYYAVAVDEVFVLDEAVQIKQSERALQIIGEFDSERQIIKNKLCVVLRELINLKEWLDLKR